jgi:hypothetical protein
LHTGRRRAGFAQRGEEDTDQDRDDANDDQKFDEGKRRTFDSVDSIRMAMHTAWRSLHEFLRYPRQRVTERCPAAAQGAEAGPAIPANVARVYRIGKSGSCSFA